MSRLLVNYDNYITFEYGEQILQGNPIFHDGIDIVGETYQGWHDFDEIKAHTAGTVIEADYDDGRGNHICIQTSNDTYMTYNHLNTMYVGVGQWVEQGQVIGYMGATGGCTGGHLHWGINYNGEWIDPTPYLENDFYIEPDIRPTADEHMCDEVRVAYVDVLDRMPDESGFGNYTNFLANGRTVEEMYSCLMNSEEYANKVKPDLAGLYFVIKCYSIILGRMPESLEVAIGWIPRDNSIDAKIETFNGIWLSDEAKNRRG